MLYLSLRGVDWRRVWQTIAGAQWRFLAAAAGLTCVSCFLRSLRWRILLSAEERIGAGTVFGATMAGYLGNNFLPARAGEVIRTLVISRRSSLSKTYVLTTALSERLADAIALVLWSSLILLQIRTAPRWMQEASRTTAVIAAVGALAIALLPHTGGLYERVLARVPLPAALRTRLLRLVDQVLLGLRAFHHAGRFLGFVTLTVVIWTLDACGVIAGSHALGLHVTFSMAMLLLAGLGLSSALPSAPGYVGIYQFVAVTVLVPFGIGRDAALAYILVFQALGYAVFLALGLPVVYWVQGGKSRRIPL